MPKTDINKRTGKFGPPVQRQGRYHIRAVEDSLRRELINKKKANTQKTKILGPRLTFIHQIFDEHKNIENVIAEFIQKGYKREDLLIWYNEEKHFREEKAKHTQILRNEVKKDLRDDDDAR